MSVTAPVRVQRSFAPAWLLAIALLAAALAVGVDFTLTAIPGIRDVAAVYVFAGITTLCAAIPLAVARRERRPVDVFEPIVFLCGLWVLSYASPALLIATDASDTWSNWGSRAVGETLGLLLRGQVTALLGLLALLGGYYGVSGARRGVAVEGVALSIRRFREWRFIFIAGSLLVTFIFVQAVGGAAFLLTHLNDRIRIFSGLNYLSLAPVVLVSVFLLSISSAYAATGRISRGLVALGVLAVGLNTMLANKTIILGIVVATLVTRHYLRARVHWLALAALLLPVAGVAAAFDLYFREYLVIREITSVQIVWSPLELTVFVWKHFSSAAFITLQTLMLMIDAVPRVIPLQLGGTYVVLPFMAIPRAIYPGKPIVATEQFSQAVFPDWLADGTSIPTSMLGEFYMNFGVVGVMLGCAISGVLLRHLYERLLRRPRDPFVIASHALVMATIFPWLRGDTFGPTVFILSVLLPMLVLHRLSRARTVQPDVQPLQ